MTLATMSAAQILPQVPGYALREQLYHGSRTSVYRAVEQDSQRSVILKLLQQPFPSFHELLQFRNQYLITHNLPVTGIVHPYRLEPYGNSYVLVLEDFGGISLQEYAMGQPLSVGEVIAIALQLAEILHELHQACVIHKDIKPSNILIHPESKQIKLIDFSIASRLPKATAEIKDPQGMEGTLAYLAPEQTGRMNRGIDYRADFYALGITLFELLTGQLPFTADEPMVLVHCHLAQPPPDAHESCTQVPEVLSDIVAKLMAKNAEDRYQSAWGLRHDLLCCLEQWQTTGHLEPFALASHDICDRFLIPEKLYGREAEVQTLLAACDRVAAGATEWMLVAGFSGIGKTAVVNEIHKPVARQRGYFVKGKFDQFQRNIPFSAFVQALRNLMGQLLSESDAQLALWQTDILTALGDNAQVMIDVIPELEKIVGPQPAALELSGMAAQNRFNALFPKFIQVFATAEHPLVIFLDDLQWADAASLRLLQLLLGASQAGYLLLLGAYRDNEVFPAHPLMLTLAAVQEIKATVHTLTLKPLSEGSVRQLVADTLACSPALARPLADLVYQKTQGNPFFATQFLKALYQDGLITFDPQANHWQCELSAVRAAALTNDVVEFIAQQLQKLPAETQAALQLAGCVGNQFDLRTLAIISEQSELATAQALWPALQAGLVMPQDEVYKFYWGEASLAGQAIAPTSGAYRFLHDRVQQAAYSLIPAAQKPITHLHIGQLLQRHTPPAERDDRLFDIVNQLNYGLEQLVDPAERTELAQLNLAAGQRAKQATAYAAAYAYFDQGIQLLGAEAWQRHYPLALGLYVGAAEAACLKTDFATMKTLCDDILTVVTDIADQVKIYELLILYHHTQSQFRQAVTLAVQTLERLGETFPAAPDTADFLAALNTTTELIQQVGLANLTHLPPMQDEHKLAAMRVLRGACYPAYFAAPEILGLLVCRLIDVTLKYGYSPLTPFAFGIFSVLLNGGVGDIQTGQQFGELAIALEQQQSDLQYRAVTYNAIYGLSRHFYKPVRECLEPLIAGYQSYAENGDAESSAYCLINAYFCTILSGHNLGDTQSQFEKYIQQVVGFKQEQVIHQLHIWMQVVDNLSAAGDNPAILRGAHFDIQAKLPQLYETHNFNTINYAHTAQALLAYLFGEYPLGLEHAAATEPHLGASTGKFFVTAHTFYYSLCLAACYDQAIPAVQADYREKLQSNQEKLETWASYCPANFLHRSVLVAAEICRLNQDRATAIDLYDRAIATAKDHGFLQDEALANELAAKFYLGWGKEMVAAGYLQEAYYAYARWGAKAKTTHLEACYPQLLQPILQAAAQPLNVLETLVTLAAPQRSIHAANAASSSASSSLNTALDFATVLKAAQSLSGIMELDQLLHQLTQIILQNSGGDRCALILPNESGVWQVAAVATPGRIDLYSELLAETSHVPAKLIQYVKNTQETVVMHDLKDALPIEEAYFEEWHPHSILGVPIVNQRQLIGVLYLENRSVSHVFTSDRLLVLNFFCSQAAISLENARLYQQSQRYAQTLEKVQLQTIQQEKMASLGQLVAGVAHEINNPINFIYGNLKPAEEYMHDLLELLELYQTHCDPPPAVQTCMEEIDLEFLQDDLPKLMDSMKLGADRIRKIVLSLRNFSRLDEADIKAVDIHEGIDSTLLILQHRLKANELRPEITVVKNYQVLPPVECYAGQLNQVFMNLLANAIDALEEVDQRPDGGPCQQITITTEAIDEGQAVAIRIRDNGMGMTEAVKARIFDHLFTTKEVGKGTGLGLAIARSIVVEKHQGTLEVNSCRGEGAEFLITLPTQFRVALPT